MIFKGPFKGLQEYFTGYFTPISQKNQQKQISLNIKHFQGISNPSRKNHFKKRNLMFALQGKLHFEDFALDQSLTGYVQYVAGRHISYRIDFKGYNDLVYTLNLKKRLRITAPLKSFSTLEGILIEARSKEIIGSVNLKNRDFTVKKLVQSIFSMDR